jgi:putative spermidine/putrescine transport system ATP-binding protein
VALARALVIRPRILLLDEPLSNLDAKLRDEMRLEIREIQRKLGITALFVTHDQVEALSMCDRIAVQHQGELVQFGTPFEIYERPRAPFVAEFVGRTNRLRGVAQTASTVTVGPLTMHVLEAPPGGSDVLVMIRPHRIQIAAPRGSARAAGQANSITGRVRRVTYVGDLLQYDVEIASGVLQVERATASGLQPFHEGDLVELTWSSADTLVFRADA